MSDPALISLLERAAAFKAEETRQWATMARAAELMGGEKGLRAVAHARLAGLDPFALQCVTLAREDPQFAVLLYFVASNGKPAMVASCVGCITCRAR